MRGVQFGASGSKRRVLSAETKPWPSRMVSVWSPFVTMRPRSVRRTGW